ncbi:MAG: PqqD family protein [Desulfobulbaceae bacterium]|nr:PqqD family protein [Desulfobulbaceae bacterium]MDY0351575.1 PqqD family protein [Desulfobulbaceae bacterium]
MVFNRSKQASRFNRPGSKDQALECIPVKNPRVAEEDSGNGEVRLAYQVQVKPWFQGIYKRFSSRRNTVIDRKLQLDVMGTAVWRMIDGQRTVREIVDGFQTAHQTSRREAEISVTTFFRELGKRGLLAMREGKISRSSPPGGA